MVPCISFVRVDLEGWQNIPRLSKKLRRGIKSLPNESWKECIRKSVLRFLSHKMLLERIAKSSNVTDYMGLEPGYATDRIRLNPYFGADRKFAGINLIDIWSGYLRV